MFEDMFDDENAATEDAVAEDYLKPAFETQYSVGHEDVEKHLLGMVQEGRLPHAIIFTGLKGIGKSTIAYRLARYLLSHPEKDEAEASMGLFGEEELPEEKAESFDVDEQGSVFRQVAARAHPDLMVIEREYDEAKDIRKDNIDVASIREISRFVQLTASGPGAWRVIIVDDADMMNRNAQNAILKNLEEPPKNTVFILIAHRLGALIPTVRSRSRTINFQPLAQEYFKELIRKHDPSIDDDVLQGLYGMMSGSVGNAVEFIDENGLTTMTLVSDLMKSWPHWDWSSIHATADMLSRKGQEKQFKAFQDVFLWMGDAALYAKAKGNAANAQNFGAFDSEVINNLIAAYSLEDWIKICENLKDHFLQSERARLDKKNTVLGVFSILSDARKAA